MLKLQDCFLLFNSLLRQHYGSSLVRFRHENHLVRVRDGKVHKFFTQVEVQIVVYVKDSVKVEVLIPRFYSSNSKEVQFWKSTQV